MLTPLTEPYSETQLKAILHPLINQWFFSKFREFSLPQLYGVMEIHNRKNILISAPTGATKCLTPDETVLVNENGFTKLISGEALIQKAEKGKLVMKVGTSGRLIKFDNLQSYSLQSHNTFSLAKAMVYHEKSKDTLLKIKTEYGREVKISRHHPLLSEKRGWIKAEELHVGEKIAVPKKIVLPEREIPHPGYPESPGSLVGWFSHVFGFDLDPEESR